MPKGTLRKTTISTRKQDTHGFDYPTGETERAAVCIAVCACVCEGEYCKINVFVYGCKANWRCVDCTEAHMPHRAVLSQ